MACAKKVCPVKIKSIVDGVVPESQAYYDKEFQKALARAGIEAEATQEIDSDQQEPDLDQMDGLSEEITYPRSPVRIPETWLKFIRGSSCMTVGGFPPHKFAWPLFYGLLSRSSGPRNFD